MNKNIIDMIIEVSMHGKDCVALEVYTGGDENRNGYEIEIYPCLAAYWQERLVKKEQEP